MVLEGGPTEGSGVAASRAEPGVYYTHDDNLDPVLTRFDETGTVLGTHEVVGAAVVDWEDLAAAECPDGGDCLVIADIGDNDAQRLYVDLYVVREPAAGEDAVVDWHWRASWPDGPQDAETLLVHPLTGEVTLVAKDLDGTARIGRLPSTDVSSIQVLTVVDTLTLAAADEGDRLITGGSWDPDGEQLVLRARERVLAWQTDPCDPDAHWQDVPMGWETPAMPRAEGVDFTPAGGLVFVGEGDPTPVAFAACPDWAAGSGACRDDEDPDPEGCGCSGGDTGAAWLLGPLLLGLSRRGRGSPLR